MRSSPQLYATTMVEEELVLTEEVFHTAYMSRKEEAVRIGAVVETGERCRESKYNLHIPQCCMSLGRSGNFSFRHRSFYLNRVFSFAANEKNIRWRHRLTIRRKSSNRITSGLKKNAQSLPDGRLLIADPEKTDGNHIKPCIF